MTFRIKICMLLFSNRLFLLAKDSIFQRWSACISFHNVKIYSTFFDQKNDTESTLSLWLLFVSFKNSLLYSKSFSSVHSITYELFCKDCGKILCGTVFIMLHNNLIFILCNLLVEIDTLGFSYIYLWFNIMSRYSLKFDHAKLVIDLF